MMVVVKGKRQTQTDVFDPLLPASAFDSQIVQVKTNKSIAAHHEVADL